MTSALNEKDKKIINAGITLFKKFSSEKIKLSDFSFTTLYNSWQPACLPRMFEQFQFDKNEVIISIRDWGDWFYENDDEYQTLSYSSIDELSAFCQEFNLNNKSFLATFNYSDEWINIHINEVNLN